MYSAVPLWGSIVTDNVISESGNQGQFTMELKENDHAWSFSYNSFVKLYGKKFGSHNMTVLYPNLCYKGTALYMYNLLAGTESETKEFMQVCVQTIKKYPLDDQVSPVFIFERLCSIIFPVSMFLLHAIGHIVCHMYSKTCVKRPLSKIPKIGFQDQLSLNADQKYCRMLQRLHLS